MLDEIEQLVDIVTEMDHEMEKIVDDMAEGHHPPWVISAKDRMVELLELADNSVRNLQARAMLDEMV